MTSNKHLTRIGIFYDGNYFIHITNYYNYVHERRSHLSISGLHGFIREQVAQLEGNEPNLCRVVDAHYFRGRLSAWDASQRGNLLYYDRVLDDVLMSENVVTHYLPLKSIGGRKEEKGVDVWLALDAYEMALTKHYDVVVLVAADGNYKPLARKLNTLGIRVMVLSWEFEFTNDEGRKMVTRTSQDLLEEVSYPVAMHELIENRVKRQAPIINNLFVKPEGYQRPMPREHESDETLVSTILSIKSGYGFIKYPPNNLFFYHDDVQECDFNDLVEGDEVEFELGINSEGGEVAKSVRKLE